MSALVVAFWPFKSSGAVEEKNASRQTSTNLTGTYACSDRPPLPAHFPVLSRDGPVLAGGHTVYQDGHSICYHGIRRRQEFVACHKWWVRGTEQCSPHKKYCRSKRGTIIADDEKFKKELGRYCIPMKKEVNKLSCYCRGLFYSNKNCNYAVNELSRYCIRMKIVVML